MRLACYIKRHFFNANIGWVQVNADHILSTPTHKWDSHQPLDSLTHSLTLQTHFSQLMVPAFVCPVTIYAQERKHHQCHNSCNPQKCLWFTSYRNTSVVHRKFSLSSHHTQVSHWLSLRCLMTAITFFKNLFLRNAL